MSILYYAGQVKHTGTWMDCHRVMHELYGHDIDNAEIV